MGCNPPRKSRLGEWATLAWPASSWRAINATSMPRKALEPKLYLPSDPGRWGDPADVIATPRPGTRAELHDVRVTFTRLVSTRAGRRRHDAWSMYVLLGPF